MIPTLPSLSLSLEEQLLIQQLRNQYQRNSATMLQSEKYYFGEQEIKNLRIAVPKELEGHIQSRVGWGAMAVDPYVERLNADCFRRVDATDGDEYLMAMMDANNFASEQTLAFTDALSMGPAYWVVGSPASRGDAPVVTVESPLNTAVLWDLRGTSPRAMMQEYWSEDGRRRGALLVPGKTVHMAQNDKGEWVVTGRDEHGFNFVPVVRMANRPRTNNRSGSSEITIPLQAIIDEACRTLMCLAVGREVYSAPQKAILGAAEAAFTKADGSVASVLETYMTKVLAIERDENGDLPTLFQFTAYDPSVFTKVLDWLASSAAGIVSALPTDMGLYTQGNPASAEAGLVADDRRNRRTKRMQRQFTGPLCEVAKMAVRFDNLGKLPAEYEQLAIDWTPPEMFSPALVSDAVSKEISAGAVPATSDVTLKRLGYNAVDRQRLAQDRVADDARNMGMALAHGLLPQQGGTGGDTEGV
ncbi:phage portal protein [Nocardioides marmoriginsengisoli]|uniref:Phage portal protein n=1 Tax=Nocardioides marmoriginsengisoli TaxID=661483 RepID=A0A3N0CJL2_9ACTN|nr:phage portal protein [Nocardioides marmoriginsengisoli]RNL63640.1 phage portal protein [Nocardioides marmoriginsengisoli]